MQIRLNGKLTSLPGPTSIGALIRDKGLEAEAIVVEHNRAIVDTTALDGIPLEENDTLEILRFVGGG